MSEYEAVGPSQPDWPDGGRTVFAESDRRLDGLLKLVKDEAAALRRFADTLEAEAERLSQ